MSFDSRQQVHHNATSRRAVAVIASLIVISLAGCSGAKTDGDRSMKIGGLAPLSGEAAFLGDNTLNYGAKLAIDTANDNGGVMGKPVDFVTQDDERRTEATVSGFRNLIGQGVDAGLGPTSATIPGVLDTMKAAEIPWFPIGGTPVLDDGLQGTMVYRNFPSDSLQVPAMLLDGAKRGPRIGLVFENNASGQGQRSEAMKYLDGTGDLELVDDLLLAPGQSSYRSEVSKFFSRDYDAILWQLTDATAASFFANAKELGSLNDQYFVGTDAALAEATIKILKPYLGSATFDAVAPAVEGPGLDSYTKLYKDKFDSEPLVLADIGYDAATAVMLAAEQAQSLEPQAIAKAIPEVTNGGTSCVSFEECAKLIRQGEDANFDGAGNTLSFDDAHNVTSKYSVSSIASDGKVEVTASVQEKTIKALIATVGK